MSTTYWEKCLKIADKSEEIVDNWLKSKGYCIFKPENGCSHILDRLAIDKNRYTFIAWDVKCKEPRWKDGSQGYDRLDFEKYLQVAKNNTLKTIIIFYLNPKTGIISGNTIENLLRPDTIDSITYPLYEKTEKADVIYFAKTNMRDFYKLTEKEMNEIKEVYGK